MSERDDLGRTSEIGVGGANLPPFMSDLSGLQGEFLTETTRPKPAISSESPARIMPVENPCAPRARKSPPEDDPMRDMYNYGI